MGINPKGIYSCLYFVLVEVIICRNIPTDMVEQSHTHDCPVLNIWIFSVILKVSEILKMSHIE